jgi:transketolase
MNLEPARLRRTVLEMAHSGQTVHVPCAFSLIEILSVLYKDFIRRPNGRPDDPERDVLALSKGHGVMALYAVLAELGWIDKAAIKNYNKDGSPLRGLSENNIPGVDVTSGSMGHGLPIAAGWAFGLKRQNSGRRVYCVVGDGELNEGSMWEALAFAGHHKLDNLTVIVDANQFQAMGPTKDILDLEPFEAKFEAFGFFAAGCDGHDRKAMTSALKKLIKKKGKPQCLVARTVKGKGVSFMEADNKWHYTRLTKESLEKALAELPLL